MRNVFASPVARLVGRALVVGVGVLVAQLQAADQWDAAVVRAALVAGALAAFEVLTPLNAAVGVGKPPKT